MQTLDQRSQHSEDKILVRQCRGGELTLIGHLDDLLQVLFQNLQRAKLLLLILDNRLRGDHLLRQSRRDQDIVLLGDLDPTLFGVDLADSRAVAGLFQGELLRLVLGELDDVQPCHVVTLLAVRLDDARRPVEESLEALDQDRPQGACAQVPGDTLVAVQHAVVLANETQDLRHIVFRGDEGKVLGILAREVVDLDVVRMRLGDFGRQRRVVARGRSGPLCGRLRRRGSRLHHDAGTGETETRRRR